MRFRVCIILSNTGIITEMASVVYIPSYHYSTYDAIKSFRRLNSFVELETKRLFQKDATERNACARTLLLTDWFVMMILN